jgi:hypothetical protein
LVSVNPLHGIRNTNHFNIPQAKIEEEEKSCQNDTANSLVPFGGDVHNEEGLPLVRLQAHFLAVAILSK